MARGVSNSILIAVSAGSLEFGQRFNASITLVEAVTDSSVLTPIRSMASWSSARSRDVALCAT